MKPHSVIRNPNYVTHLSLVVHVNKKINAFFYSLSSTQFIFEMLQLMLQDRLHWFGKRLTCNCYVAYVKLSHNVTFYEQIQI